MAFIRPWGCEPRVDITSPVHVWQGRHDRMVPYAHGQWLASHIPSAVPHLFDDEGHLSLANHPVRRHPGCAGRLRALSGEPPEDDPVDDASSVVVAALDSLPEVFRERLGSVAIVVEDEAVPGATAVRPGARPVRPLPGRAADVVGGGPQSVSEQDHDLPGTAAARLARRRTTSPGASPRPSITRSPTTSGSRTSGSASSAAPAAENGRAADRLCSSARDAPEPGK